MIIYSAIVLALFSLTIVPGQLWLHLGIIGLAPALWCYGGLPIYRHMENYGPKSRGQLRYRLHWIFFSSIFRPKVAVQMAMANSGNYSVAFYIAIALAFIDSYAYYFFKENSIKI